MLQVDMSAIFACAQQAVDRVNLTRKRRRLTCANIDVATIADILPRPVRSGVKVPSCRPAQALKWLNSSLATDWERLVWLESARIEAILGSCPKSLPSVVAGIRAWLSFAAEILRAGGQAFPPTLSGLLAWSLLFRSEHTFANYLGYARVGCALVNKPCHVFDDPVLRRAKVAVAKRGGFKKRVPMFIRLDVIRAMLALVLVEPVWVLTAMWCLTAYTFLLRVPSECLTITIGGGSEDDCQHSSLLGHDDCIVLVLKSRKNKPQGSRLTRCCFSFLLCCVHICACWHRTCWCSTCPEVCPVHRLGNFFSSLPVGSKPFAGISPGKAIADLRALLARLSVKDASLYRTHDLRRGHARDMQARGATAGEILAAGEWRSAGFMAYMDKDALECDAVLEAHFQLSDDEDDAPGVAWR